MYAYLVAFECFRAVIEEERTPAKVSRKQQAGPETRMQRTAACLGHWFALLNGEVLSLAQPILFTVMLRHLMVRIMQALCVWRNSVVEG